MDYHALERQLDEKRILKDINKTDYRGFQKNAQKAFLYFLDAMFPNYGHCEECEGRAGFLRGGAELLRSAIAVVSDEAEAARVTERILTALPEIYRVLQTDITAGYEGDPACRSFDEVVLAYPAFIAIAAHRIAHALYLEKQPLIARIISEYAHRKTGIDIHPGATIGEYFFIDHGTGVVIGETTVIGEHVKLYQHVTLGAKSFAVAPDGTLVKGIKRHPNIGNHVVIYAGATILGGDVCIGDRSVIGGNVWLTHSVGEGQTVTQKN